MAPFGLLYLVFTIWPVLQGLWVSLWKWGLMGAQSFIGLDNYTRALGDKYFWGALANTTKFVVITVPLLIVTAVTLALLANRATKLRRFARSAFYIPSVLSVSVISFIAIYLASPHMGFINTLLHDIGILPAGVEPQWLLGKNLAWITLSFTTVWWTVGFSMLLYLAALQEISDEVYEAADIDGASKTRQLFSITLPLLTRTHWLVFLLQVLASYKVFGQVQLITGGGPGTATRSIVHYIYEQGFAKNNLGYASAMSFGLFFILIVFSLLQIRAQNRGEAK
jgi:multiple sugar transport system permease protein